MSLPWKRLIRFETSEGKLAYGEPILPTTDYDLGLHVESDLLKAYLLEGDDIFDTSGRTRLTEKVVSVKKIVGPLTPSQVPIVRCVGLNSATHIREAGRQPPPFPSMFFKPNLTIGDHNGTVLIPKICQDDQADYEGELCLVIGQDCKDVRRDEALAYVAGFTAGNDISSRKLQRDPALAGRVPQWGFSKGFDGYAPLGPCLVRPDELGDLKKLQLQTTVDGEVRQSITVSDLLFDWSVIMTGTPGGVGAGLDPPRYLVPGTKVDVYVTGIGTLRNDIQFA